MFLTNFTSFCFWVLLILPSKDIFVLYSPVGIRTWSLELPPWEPRASVSPSPPWRRCSLVRCVSAARSLPSTTPCLDAATEDLLCWSTRMNNINEKGFSHLFLSISSVTGLWPSEWGTCFVLFSFFFLHIVMLLKESFLLLISYYPILRENVCSTVYLLHGCFPSKGHVNQ